MGVIRRLQIEHEYPEAKEEAALQVFNVRCKHYTRPAAARLQDQKSKVTQQFSDHINQCLRRVNKKQLKEQARHRLCAYISEIIDNAEEHGQMGDWSIQGYLDTSLDVPTCEIVIFNFGSTISSTFGALPDTSYTYEQVQRYIKLHQKGNLFNRGWAKDDLYTLVALQGSVSTKNHTRDDTRGNGTVDLITFFQRIHQECVKDAEGASARMVLASGSTSILFDGSYDMRPNAEGVNIIAFNKENDLEKKPDATYVRSMVGVTFPGAVISVKFPLKAAAVDSATALGGQPNEQGEQSD